MAGFVVVNPMGASSVPFLDLIEVHRDLEEELVAAFRGALHSAAFIGGTSVEEFEHEFGAYCGSQYCVGTGSGTDALRFALMASGVERGDAVVTVSHTFVATVEAVIQAGAEPEFVDIDERTYNMSVGALREYLGACKRHPNTGRPIGLRTGRPIKAVLPVHLYGHMAAMDPLLDLAREHGLLVIEDACQAHGAEYLSTGGGGPEAARWSRAGSFGKAAAFSFYPGKNLGACGEAGAVTTDDEEVAQRVRMLRDHGQVRKYHHTIEGYNGRLDAIQAAFLRIKLSRLDSGNAQRRVAAARYRDLLDHVPGLVTPYEADGVRSNYHLYVVKADDRDRLAEHLHAQGIGSGLHYPVPVHLQACYRRLGYEPGSLPITEYVAAHVLSLPMFPTLTPEQQELVASAVAQPCQARR